MNQSRVLRLMCQY